MQTQIVILILTFLYSFTSYGQELPSSQKLQFEVLSLCDEMNEDGIVRGPAVGFAGIEPEQWRRFEILKSISQDSTLFILTDHHSAVVRCYAFEGLMNLNKQLFTLALREHEDDTTIVSEQTGCVVTELEVREFVFSLAVSNMKSNRMEYSKQDRKYIKDIVRKKLGGIIGKKNRT